MRSVVPSLSFSLAETGGMLLLGHGLPVVGRIILLPVACGIRAEEIGGDVDHGGGGGGDGGGGGSGFTVKQRQRYRRRP